MAVAPFVSLKSRGAEHRHCVNRGEARIGKNLPVGRIGKVGAGSVSDGLPYRIFAFAVAYACGSWNLSVNERYVVTVRAARLPIVGRREPGECPEVVDEMRLIVIAARDGDGGPVDARRLFHQVEHLLEALDPAE